MTRYARQMLLEDVGAAGQQRLADAHVAVIGAGGLGCPVLQYLAGAGVGRITLLDPDVVEESNLHRQPLYRMADIGRAKVHAARDAIESLNPHISVTALREALDPANAGQVVQKADVVIDAADSFAVSYTLSDACRDAVTPLVSASVLGQSGYVGAFCGPAPSLRAVFPDLPETGGATCATAGVLGPVVGMFGAIQSQLSLRILLNSDPSPMGQMITADLSTLRFGGFCFLGSREPKVSVPFIAKSMLRETDMVVEMREQSETEQPITPGALRMGWDQVGALQPTAPTQRVVLCCSSGLRAWRGASVLQRKGQDNLALLAAKACG
ncbi:HesA/MoeB/ThiF family protein [Thalassococcus sp. S3]|uniref:HesA/MoeB/ThiF family protein n=1 Tax=Thalassococcus sp. S3 TaxID=2017482 RepID=UPI001024146C|nr:HesA/MoeB/ThiF family protein [Thalassococcus sp. S3]QBF33048.1 thiamine biosynthesis protein ThiF [Thalassococcus sp. S3]